MNWSSNLAYAIGLITTDGNLSKDGRHLELTSKDIEQLRNFKKCLDMNTGITWKTSGSGKRYPRVQFSNVKLYRWLLTIGLTANKTKTISGLKIPEKYFFDFLRGHFDGDGSSYSYWDKRWKSSFMFYLQFISASPPHLNWIRQRIKSLIDINGTISESKGIFRLRYAKYSSRVIVNRMYSKKNCICLSRKRNKIFEALEAERWAGVAKLEHALP